MRYQFIQKHAGQVPVSVLCRALKVSPSGYYDFKKRKPTKRQHEREQLLVHVRQFFEKSDGSYGSIRIWEDLKACDELKAAGICAGRHRVARLMRQAGLKAAVAPKFVVMTDSKHELPIAENLLNRDFVATGANRKWASDITYVWTREGWLYLAVVLDLFSRRIVERQPASKLRGLVYAAEHGSLTRFKGSGNGPWPTPSCCRVATSQQLWQSVRQLRLPGSSGICWHLVQYEP